MADTFQLEIVTPERLFMDAQVTEAQWPAKNGYMGVLPGHAPLGSVLDTGLLTYAGPGGTGRGVVKIDGGFVEVLNDHVRILADKAEIAQE
jgi:F-type H+-transporting ATPase subunit epsilon